MRVAEELEILAPRHRQRTRSRRLGSKVDAIGIDPAEWVLFVVA